MTLILITILNILIVTNLLTILLKNKILINYNNSSFMEEPIRYSALIIIPINYHYNEILGDITLNEVNGNDGNGENDIFVSEPYIDLIYQ